MDTKEYDDFDLSPAACRVLDASPEKLPLADEVTWHLKHTLIDNFGLLDIESSVESPDVPETVSTVEVTKPGHARTDASAHVDNAENKESGRFQGVLPAVHTQRHSGKFMADFQAGWGSLQPELLSSHLL